jgi:osmotically-inducible protein OsmY
MLILNHRRVTIITAGIAATALGLGALCATSYAQNSDSMSPAASQGADADLAARVKQALHSDKSLDDRHVDVAVDHGQVVLNGFVQDSRELLVAAQVASKAAGDHKIVNRLLIKQNYPNAP